MTLQTLDRYGNAFQIKVISCLLTDKKFLISIHDILSDEFFQIKRISGLLKKY